MLAIQGFKKLPNSDSYISPSKISVVLTSKKNPVLPPDFFNKRKRTAI